MIKESNGKLVEEELISFILGKNKKLNMGELWAFPLMLRANIIINLSNTTDKLKDIYKEKRDGKELAYKVILANSKDEKLNILKEAFDKSGYFIDELYKVLKDNSIEDDDIHNLISKLREKDEKSSIKGPFIEGVLENTISSSIMSLREIESIDWREFFNKTSIVEKILLKDPSKTYENMDFESKDYYRHKIEKISRKYNIEEDKIAEKLVYLSKKERKKMLMTIKSMLDII